METRVTVTLDNIECVDANETNVSFTIPWTELDTRELQHTLSKLGLSKEFVFLAIENVHHLAIVQQIAKHLR